MLVALRQQVEGIDAHDERDVVLGGDGRPREGDRSRRAGRDGERHSSQLGDASGCLPAQLHRYRNGVHGPAIADLGRDGDRLADQHLRQGERRGRELEIGGPGVPESNARGVVVFVLLGEKVLGIDDELQRPFTRSGQGEGHRQRLRRAWSDLDGRHADGLASGCRIVHGHRRAGAGASGVLDDDAGHERLGKLREHARHHLGASQRQGHAVRDAGGDPDRPASVVVRLVRLLHDEAGVGGRPNDVGAEDRRGPAEGERHRLLRRERGQRLVRKREGSSRGIGDAHAQDARTRRARASVGDPHRDGGAPRRPRARPARRRCPPGGPRGPRAGPRP